jgi:DNA-binding NarL/FixJ family response regulator
VADAIAGTVGGRTIRLIIVDDDLFVRSSLTRLLQRQPHIEVLASFEDGHEAARAVAADPPDVALVDIRMPVLDGPATVRLIRAAAPSVRVLALTSLTDERDAASMVAAGVVGFLTKDSSPAALVHAVRSTADGLAVFSAPVADSALARLAAPAAPPELSEVEAQLLRLLCAGHTNDEIGRAIYLSASSVKQQVAVLMEKLGASNRVTLAVRAVELGLN